MPAVRPPGRRDEAVLAAPERDALLLAVQQSEGVNAATLLKLSPRVRAMVVRSLLRPSGGYLGVRYGACGSWQIPFFYLVRLLAPLRRARS